MSYLSALVKNIPEEELEKIVTKETKVEPEVVVEKIQVKDTKELKNKNAFRRKKQSKGNYKKKPVDKDYMQVLNSVQESFLLKVIPDEKTCDIIENNKMYMKNWTTPVYIDTTEDIVTTHMEKEYTFQKNRILGSRYFQNMVRELYATKFGNVSVSFNWNRNYPNSYTIKVRG